MDKQLKIRKANLSETTLLSDLALRSKAHWDYSPEFLKMCREELQYTQKDLKEHHFNVLEQQNAQQSIIVAFYALVKLSPSSIELEALFVDPNYIGRGLGRKLIEHAKSEAKALGALEMLIQGDPNAKQFYEAIGGELIGEKESGSIAGRYLPLFRINLAG